MSVSRHREILPLSLPVIAPMPFVATLGQMKKAISDETMVTSSTEGNKANHGTSSSEALPGPSSRPTSPLPDSNDSWRIALIVSLLVVVVTVLVLVVWLWRRRLCGGVVQTQEKARENVSVCHSLQDLKELRTVQHVHTNLSVCHHASPGDCPGSAGPQATDSARPGQRQQVDIADENLTAFAPMLHLYTLARCPAARTSSATLISRDFSTQTSVSVRI